MLVEDTPVAQCRMTNECQRHSPEKEEVIAISFISPPRGPPDSPENMVSLAGTDLAS